MYNGRAALSCSMNLFPTGNYFTADTRFLEEREKSLQRYLHPVNFNPALNGKLFRCMQILFQQTPSDASMSPNLWLPSNLPLSDVIHTLFAHCCQATVRTSSRIYIYFLLEFAQLSSQALAFGPTNLLTSLRERKEK